MGLLNRFTGLFRRNRQERDLDEELQFHIELKTQENIAAGMPPEEARYAALRSFGGVEQKKEECRDADRLRWIEDVIQDLRYGLRQLRRNPGFTAVAVLTLALGIGANTAIFSVIDIALLRPLPYSHPEDLVDISSLRMNGNPEAIAADFRAWLEHGKALDSIGAFGLGFNSYSEGANLTGTGAPARVRVVPVSVGFFHMLGVRPVLGRDFTSDEGEVGHAGVALLSATVWQRYFGGDHSVLHKTIHLDGRPYAVVGVMPAGLLYPPGDIWVPIVLDASNSLPNSPSWSMLYVIGRLKADVGLRQATTDLQMISHRLDSQFSPGRRRGRSHLHVHVIPLRQLLAGDVGHLLMILLSAVGFVLLIACANLANLLLARAAVRKKEMTVRAALGASRLRLARQALNESLLLAFLGGCLGSGGGLWAERALRRLVPPQLPSAGGLDYRILAFGIVVSLCAAFLFGVAPAFFTSRIDVNEGLKEGGPHTGLGGGTHRLRGLLVIGETALALILLVSAGLLGRSFLRLSDVPLGFNPEHLLLGEVWLPATLVDQPRVQANFFQAVLDRLHSLPGVQDAAATTHYPVSVFNALATGVRRADGRASLPSKPFSVAYISPDYFRTLRIRLLGGRFFNKSDVQNSRKVVILSKSAARSIFPEGEAIGHEISFKGPKGPSWYVAGVVADTRNYQLDRNPWPEIFFPFQQQPSLFMTFVIRSRGDPMRFASGLQQSVAGVDRNEPLSMIMPMDEVVQKVLAPRRFRLALLGSFALLALALGAIGLYGVISYTVTQRTHEIGIRMALGAEKREILRMVVGQGLKLALIGVAIGIAGGLALTRFLSSLLYGVKPTDPLSFIAVSIILIAVALVACYIPARRAARVDPMVALRYE
jgi:putative ABC transport system permease protein